MRRISFVLWVLAVFLAVCPTAFAGWSQSGPGANGSIPLPAGDLSGTGSTGGNPTISNLTGTGANNLTTFGTSGASKQGTIGDITSGVIGSNVPGVACLGAACNFVVSSTSQVSIESTATTFISAPSLEHIPAGAASFLLTQSGANYEVEFLSGITPFLFVQQNSAGAGTSFNVNGQAAKTGSAAAGGDMFISSGFGDGAGASGSVHIAQCTTTPVSGACSPLDIKTFKPWSGTTNTQGRGDIVANYLVRTTNTTATGVASVTVATGHCASVTANWVALGVTVANAGSSNTFMCLGCNASGTVTTSSNSVLASTLSIGATPVCGTGNTAVMACSGVGNTINFTVQCSGTGPNNTVDWQVETAQNAN